MQTVASRTLEALFHSVPLLCRFLIFPFTRWSYQQFCNLLPMIRVALPLGLLHFEKIVHYFSNSHSPV